MPPSGFLSALKMRVQDAIGGLPPDGSAIFMHAVRPRRRAGARKRSTGSGSLRDTTTDLYVCQNVHDLSQLTCLPQHIFKSMCVAGYGHVLALHNSRIARNAQSRSDFDVRPEETPKLRT